MGVFLLVFTATWLNSCTKSAPETPGSSSGPFNREAAFQQCLADICGPPSEQLDIAELRLKGPEKIPSHLSSTKTKEFKGFADKVGPLLRSSHQLAKEEIEALTEVRNEPIIIADEHFALTNYLYILEQINIKEIPLKSVILHEDSIELEIDRPEVLDLFEKKISLPHAQKLVGILAELADFKAFQEMYLLAVTPALLFYKSKNPDQDPIFSLQIDTNRALTQLDELRQDHDTVVEPFGNYTQDVFNQDLVRQLMDNETLSDEAIQRIARTVKGIDIAYALVTSPDTFPKLHELDPSVYLNEFLQSDSIQKALNTASKEIHSRELTDGLRNNVLQSCYGNFLAYKYASPTEQDISEVRKRIKEWKAQFLQNAGAIYPEVVTAEFLDSLMIRFPRTREEFNREFESDLRRRTEEARAELTSLRSAITLGIHGPRLVSRLSSLSDWNIEATQSSAEALCSELKLPTVGDAAYSVSEGAIDVSWSTINFPRIGKGVFFHELGHLVYYKTADHHSTAPRGVSGLPETNSCLIRRHDGLDSTENSRPSDSFLKEDFADMVSAIALEDSDDNYACIFIKQRQDEYLSYQTLSQTNEKDPHSASLFRLLHIEKTRKGLIPSACEGIASEEKVDFKSCVIR